MTPRKTNSVRRLSTRLPAGLLVAVCTAAVLVSACSRWGKPPPPSYVFTDPSVRFPIVIGRDRQLLDVGVGHGKDGISEMDRASVSRFLADFRRDGSGMLNVMSPSPRSRSASVSFALAELADLIEAEGIRPGAIRYRNGGRSSYGRSHMTLMYDREVAHSAPCGMWPKNLADDRKNIPYENFGCSHRNNLAAMVAKPSDLVRVRRQDDRMSPRRDVVLDKYIQGVETERKEHKKSIAAGQN